MKLTVRNSATKGGSNFRVIDLGDVLALATDEELGEVPEVGPVATDEGVERIDPVDQARVQQEFQRPVDRGWSRSPAVPGKLGQQLVGAHRIMLAPDELQDPAPQRRQPQAPLGTDLLGNGQCISNTTPVVVAAVPRPRPTGFHR